MNNIDGGIAAGLSFAAVLIIFAWLVVLPSIGFMWLLGVLH